MTVFKSISKPVVRVPPRAHFAHHRGVTLVELMIAMLILAIVCVAWLEIIGIQSAKREARRREAVERLSGMMDAFMYLKRTGLIFPLRYTMNSDQCTFSCPAKDFSTKFDDDLSPIGYQLSVIQGTPDKFSGDWVATHKWLIGSLYDAQGTESEAGKPFFVLRVCLGSQ